MTIDRKSFLKIAAGSGMSLLFGGTTLGAKQWRDRGVKLVHVQRSSLVMGSVARFQVIAEREENGYEAIRKAVKIFRDLDEKLSMYKSTSEIARLAQSAGKKPMSLSNEAAEVLSFGKWIWRETGGMFDVTIEPAMKRWGFREDPASRIDRPEEQELKKLEKLIGSDKLTVEGNQAYLEREGMAVDLGGIAGGYALDCAVEQMKKEDIAAVFINFSGDIHCFGDPLDGSGWSVHIYNPQTGEPLTEPVMLHNEALSTSGAYQNRREGDHHQSWGHLLLPGKARPVNSQGSVTAIHPSAMTADVWSTAGYVGARKPEKIRWVEVGRNHGQ